ncbi:hypothetical protein ACFX1X_044549 [Malus domestica]
MAAKNVVTDLTKGEKLVGTNYGIWHRKIQYLLNEQELLEPLEAYMDEPDLEREGTTTAQHTARYEGYSTAKKMQDQLKFAFDGTSTTRLKSLVLKFEVYRMDPKHSVSEHLRKMSTMIRDLKVVGSIITDEQQV